MPTNTSADLKDFGGPGEPVQTTPASTGAAGYDDAILRQNRINKSAPGTAAGGAGGYQFPLHNQNDYKGKVIFQAYKVIQPEITLDDLLKAEKYIKDYGKKLLTLDRKDESVATSQGLDDNAAAQNLAAQRTGKGEASATLNSTGAPKSIIRMEKIEGQKCELYMPLALIFNDNIGYETGNLNQSGAAILSGLSNSSGLVNSIKAGIEQGFGSTFDFLKGGLAGDAARLAVARAAAKIPNESLQNAVSIAGQVVMNPNTRSIFKNVTLRDFTFTFKFIPKSAAEAEVVNNIISFFRENAYPELLPADADFPLGYKFPNIFDIKIQYGGKTVGHKIKKCYLRSIQHTYNPSAMGFHSDGNPTEIDMTLSFQEHVTLSRKDILEGY